MKRELPKTRNRVSISFNRSVMQQKKLLLLTFILSSLFFSACKRDLSTLQKTDNIDVASQLIDEQTQKQLIDFKNKKTTDFENIAGVKINEEGISPSSQANTGFVVSKAIPVQLKNAAPFISAYAMWEGKHIETGNFFVEINSSQNGKTWSEWQSADLDDENEDASSTSQFSRMVLLDAAVKWVKFKITFPKTESAPAILREATFYLYSPGNTPADVLASLKTQSEEIDEKINDIGSMSPDAILSSPLATAACTKPFTVSRATWQARAPRAIAANTVVQFLIIHHEAGSNTATNGDWAARVRNVQRLHMIRRGWSDIGYNFLIDPNGIIYEGRSGGHNRIGAHYCARNAFTMGVCLLGDFTSVAPKPKALASLKKLLAWKAKLEAINPTGSGLHYQRNIARIAGHRSGGCSACPGDKMVNLLPGVRNDVKALVSSGCATR